MAVRRIRISCLRGMLRLALNFALIIVCGGSVSAVVSPLTPTDMREALAIARSPEPVRARFHSAYVFPINKVIDYVSIERLEIITEFRRLEMIGEEHARLNDSFGRGGLRDASDALRRWMGRVSVGVQLRLLPTTRYITGMPVLHVALEGPTPVPVLDKRTIGFHSEAGTVDAPAGAALVGGVIEYDFDLGQIGQNVRAITVVLEGNEVSRVSIDFRKLR